MPSYGTIAKVAMHRRLARWFYMLVGSTLANGCVDPPAPPTASGEPTDSGSTTHGVGTTTNPAADSTSSTVSSSSDGGETAAPCPFGCEEGGGGISFECDVLAQDCPKAEKCSPWANDGWDAWNATRCSPQAREPAASGEPCSVLGSATSGIDTCDIGSMCWNVDPVTLEGVCAPMCTLAGEELLCDDPDSRCVLTNEGAIALCLRECDPLQPSCASDEQCVTGPDERLWFCAPLQDAPAAPGQPCEYLNVCEAGAVCVSLLTALPGSDCEGSPGCCAAVCELGGASSCPAGTECAVWYEPGLAPPGLEGLGLCTDSPEIPPEGWVEGYRDHLIAELGV